MLIAGAYMVVGLLIYVLELINGKIDAETWGGRLFKMPFYLILWPLCIADL